MNLDVKNYETVPKRLTTAKHQPDLSRALPSSVNAKTMVAKTVAIRRTLASVNRSTLDSPVAWERSSCPSERFPFLTCCRPDQRQITRLESFPPSCRPCW